VEPSKSKLAGSGTGVKTVLVMTLTFVPAVNVRLTCWLIEYGVPKEAILVVTVFAVESAPVNAKVVFVTEGPAAQNGSVGGAKPLVVFRQLTKPLVPDPVVDVVDMLLAKTTGGGADGFVKSWAVI